MVNDYNDYNRVHSTILSIQVVVNWISNSVTQNYITIKKVLLKHDCVCPSETGLCTDLRSTHVHSSGQMGSCSRGCRKTLLLIRVNGHADVMLLNLLLLLWTVKEVKGNTLEEIMTKESQTKPMPV